MSRPRVILADDHQIVADGLRCILEPEFELVCIVNDGRALLHAAVKMKHDVIVSDLSMPELNGLEAFEELKQEMPDVRVVFLTMHHNAAYARRVMDAGAKGYILKHSAAHELVLAIRAAAEDRTFVSPAITGELLDDMRSGRAEDHALGKLTLRQREILRLAAEGHSAKAIATRLGISSRTVEFHKYSMMEVLRMKSTADLIRFALQNDVLDL